MSWTFVVTQMTHEVEAILLQIHDTCSRFGSTHKHYGNFTSQLTRTKHYKKYISKFRSVWPYCRVTTENLTIFVSS